MVRLKEEISTEIVEKMLEFQFHIGTIKSIYTTKKPQGAKGFQFHIGTIKRRRKKRIFNKKNDFNSILVRLKGHMLPAIYVKQDISIPYWYD